MITNYLFRVV